MISKIRLSGRSVFIHAALFFAGSALLPASTLFVGFNTQTPVQLYSTTGTYMQDFSATSAAASTGTVGNAIAAGTYGSGDYFTVTPSSSMTSSVVTEYNNSMVQTGSFSVADLITDDGSIGSDLLFSGYDGEVYVTTQSGTVLSSWNTGYTHVGITSNGTDIFTTEGDNHNLIDIWSPTGSKLGSIVTPLNSLYGLGYDSTTGDFYAGSTNYVYQLSGTGTLLNTYDLTGDSRTPDGAVHDGLEVGNFGTVVTTTPEPASLLLFLAGLLSLGLLRFASVRKAAVRAGSLLGVAAAACFGMTVSLSPSSTTVAVGTPLTFTATASGVSGTLTYQYLLSSNGSSYAIKKDWYSYNYFNWTPTEAEGSYDIQVQVKSSTGATASATASVVVTSRVTGTTPVVNTTQNALVALYSMPACTAGHTARVRFKLPTDTIWSATSSQTCTGTKSLNFYVAGMRANSTYQMQQDVYNGPFDTMGPMLSFTTKSVPDILPAFTVPKAPAAPNSTVYPLTFTGDAGVSEPFAVDAQGNVVWYMTPPRNKNEYFTHVRAGGTFYEHMYDDASRSQSILRLYDLAGNILWETNYAALSARLTAMGDPDPITSIHHETVDLPNGWIALFGSSERILNQGAGYVDVFGDQVVVIDSNFNVKWYWNEFEHLDTSRPAVLGEVCFVNQAGCPPITKPGYTRANDWTHSNAIYPTLDGNLIVSSRHQDFVYKVDYANGTGSGAVLWELGKGGSFTVDSSNPYPWNSHQHDAQINPNGNLTLFDNGNTRVAEMHGGDSRAQAWSIDESNMVATLAANIDQGVFSEATGSNQLLSNGNYFAACAFIGASTTQLHEFTTSGSLQHQLNIPHISYRSFRMRSLYSGEN